MNGQLLEGVALALYWAEGAKSVRARVVDLANSDPDILKIFLQFLRKNIGVDEKRLRVYIYCHDASKVSEIVTYWSKHLDIPVEQFSKPYIKSVTQQLSKRKMPYGLAHVRYADKKILLDILSRIDSLRNGQVAERSNAPDCKSGAPVAT